MRYDKKPNRYEQTVINKKKLEHSLAGEGLYLYQNNSDGELILPKPDAHGSRKVIKRGTFEGDSYFMQMVRSNELKFVREIEAPNSKKMENTVMNEKLILDQPPTITDKGAVEHTATAPQPVSRPITEKEVDPKEVLLNEVPIDGVDILID